MIPDCIKVLQLNAMEGGGYLVLLQYLLLFGDKLLQDVLVLEQLLEQDEDVMRQFLVQQLVADQPRLHGQV